MRRRNLMGQVPITANVTIENITGSWGESSKPCLVIEYTKVKDLIM